MLRSPERIVFSAPPGDPKKGTTVKVVLCSPRTTSGPVSAAAEIAADYLFGFIHLREIDDVSRPRRRSHRATVHQRQSGINGSPTAAHRSLVSGTTRNFIVAAIALQTSGTVSIRPVAPDVIRLWFGCYPFLR